MELSAGDFLAAALAGCATIGTSILVEKCGGVIGGTIGEPAPAVAPDASASASAAAPYPSPFR